MLSTSKPSTDDPLARVFAPPPNESQRDKENRIRAEQEAKKRSDAIDEEISKQLIARKNSKPVKILLLGQSESGKSTTLKNFQLMSSPKAFRAELPSWRAVIQLNIVRSVRLIVDTITMAHQVGEGYPPLGPEQLKLRMKLSPLLRVEDILIQKLAPNSQHHIKGESTDSVFDNASNAPEAPAVPIRTELTVNSRSTWKTAFKKWAKGVEEIDFDDPADPGRVLFACKDDMIALWSDPIVREILEVARIRLQDQGGFYLDDLPRVAGERYTPTNDDVLRARLKTVGVTEFRFDLGKSEFLGKFGPGASLSSSWHVYDVGGHRSMRTAWVPFFDDMNAIIFLAPISCFDQVLAEDPSVNRLADSVQLWTSIVSNKLLADTPLVLFLNKCDLLKAKIEAGSHFAKHIISYGDRPNTFEGCSNYLRKKFAGIHKEKSPKPRPFHFHFTSVTDSTTVEILRHVQDDVIMQNLKSGGLL
ncbi:G-alpha-domain-containing protein [Thelephora ganbajun]|uniref:G-alpha-domain-containing protein n=1 Tax=Thelephora ganbajun TaxID=370292 RepID=A0ACB6ZS91_THEGA|nr:G-alpha-domain-containing protein [Thelephora ganbajun]